MERWKPPLELSRREEFIVERPKRTRKLFAFLRLRRHELFDDGFQVELEEMYRRTGAGERPVPPAMLCMTLLLQAYLGTSDAVELTVLDLRWQLVLGCLNAESPPDLRPRSGPGPSAAEAARAPSVSRASVRVRSLAGC
jgi:hypothetical protein